MGQGDYMPAGGHRRKPIDPKRIKEIQEGGKKAGVIRKKADIQHHEHDVPKAEEELLKELKDIKNNKPK